jgi:hypothetical protein
MRKVAGTPLAIGTVARIENRWSAPSIAFRMAAVLALCLSSAAANRDGVAHLEFPFPHR